MNKEKKVLVVGSVAYDDIETPSCKFTKSLGGSAIYFSWACKFFTDVDIVGVIGDDFTKSDIALIKKRGIDIRALKIKKGKTFHWKGKYNSDFNVAHTLKTELNVFAEFEPKLLSDQKLIKYLFLGNIDPKIQLKVAKEMKNPKIIAMDTMNYWIENNKTELLEVIKISDILIINDSEARQIAEEFNLVKCGKKILSLGIKALVIKKGEYGLSMFYYDKKGEIKIFSAPSFPVEDVIDPTGAGDSFAGAFMGYIATQKTINEKNMRNAAVFGSVVASFTVEGFSVEKLKKVSIKDIEERFHQLHDIAYFGSGK